jgi:hypothetical protein
MEKQGEDNLEKNDANQQLEAYKSFEIDAYKSFEIGA